MKKQRKCITQFMLCMCAMCCILFCACTQASKWAVTESEHSEIVADLNAGSYFGGYALGQPYDGPGNFSNPFAETQRKASVSIGSFEVLPSVNIVDADGHGILYADYGYYPVDSNELVICAFAIRGSEYHVFGISVGDDIEESIQKLRREGYKEPEVGENYDLRLRSNSVDQYRLLRLGNVLIVLQTYYGSGPSIVKIEVHLWTDDEDNGDPGMIW